MSIEFYLDDFAKSRIESTKKTKRSRQNDSNFWPLFLSLACFAIKHTMVNVARGLNDFNLDVKAVCDYDTWIFFFFLTEREKNSIHEWPTMVQIYWLIWIHIKSFIFQKIIMMALNFITLLMLIMIIIQFSNVIFNFLLFVEIPFPQGTLLKYKKILLDLNFKYNFISTNSCKFMIISINILEDIYFIFELIHKLIQIV